MLTLVSLVVAAGSTSPVTQALASYDRGEYSAAASLLERALGSGIDDKAERSNARLHLAASYFAMGDATSTDRVLAVLLQEAPDLAVDSALFPPPFVARLEKVRASIRETPVVPAVASQVPKPELVQPNPPVEAGSLRRWWWIPASLGVVAAGVGTGLVIKADGDHRRLITPPMSPADVLSPSQATQLAQGGTLAQSVGWTSVIVGAAALVTALVLLLVGS